MQTFNKNNNLQNYTVIVIEFTRHSGGRGSARSAGTPYSVRHALASRYYTRYTSD